MLQHNEGELRRAQTPSNLLTDEENNALHAVSNTFLISFRRLEKHYPAAARLLSIMVFFHRQGAPEYLLRHDEDEATFQLAMLPLIDFDFVKKGRGSAFGLHGLVQIATRGYLGQNGTFEFFSFEAMKRMVQHFPRGGYENWTKCHQLYLHAEEALLNHCDLQECAVEYGKLLERMGEYSMSRGNLDRAAGAAMGAVKIKQEILAGGDFEVLLSKRFLDRVTGELGNWGRAGEIYSEILNAMSSDPRNPKYAVLFPSIAGSYAGVLSRLGCYQDAEKAARLAKKAAVLCSGNGSQMTRDAMSQLADILIWTEKWKEAEEILLELQKSDDSRLSVDHPDRFSGLSQLSSVYESTGNYDYAQELRKEALDGFMRVLGESHLRTLACLASYTVTLIRMGKDDEAEAACEDLLKARTAIYLPDSHPLVVSTKFHLAQIYRNRKAWVEAETLVEAVLASRQSNTGPQDLDILLAQMEFALLQNDQGHYKEAEKQLRALLNGEVCKANAEHSFVIGVKENLATTIFNQGKLRNAIKMEKGTEAAYSRRLGKEHPKTMRASERWRKWQQLYKSIPIFPFWPFSKE